MDDRSTVICRRNGDILLVQHHIRWTLPGGRVRRNETPLQCARRELEEETTLVAGRIAYLWQFDGFNKRHHVFVAGIDGVADPRAQSEIRSCRWFATRDMPTLLISVPTREILDLALRWHHNV